MLARYRTALKPTKAAPIDVGRPEAVLATMRTQLVLPSLSLWDAVSNLQRAQNINLVYNQLLKSWLPE